jgi:hypothetical protein
MKFPLNKKVRTSQDSESFRRIDLARETEIPVGKHHPGAFGVERRNHVHEGVDLYAQAGDAVYAMMDGVVVDVQPFTGPSAGSPWWQDTDGVVIEHTSCVLIYGELRPAAGIIPGVLVREGDILGYVTTVLSEDKGRPMNMLHLERYVSGVTTSCGIWPKGSPRPFGLEDPTDLLLNAARTCPITGLPSVPPQS